MTTRPLLLTIEAVAAMLHETVTCSAVRAAIKAKALRATRIGKRYYVTEAAINRWLEWEEPANPRGCISDQIPAIGSFATGQRPSGRALAEAAIGPLLKRRSPDTSPPARQNAKGQRSPQKLRLAK